MLKSSISFWNFNRVDVYTFIVLKTKGLDLYHILEELVKTNDCVIVPGFGGFETHYQSASIDPGKGILIPPTKQVIFRSDYIKGQGVIQQELIRKVGYTQAQADEAVDHFVIELKAHLEEKGKLALPGVGILTGRKPGNCTFVPEKNENFLADSFGLDMVKLPQGSSAVLVQSKAIPEPPFEKQPIVQKRASTKVYIFFGSVVILTLLSITFIMSEFYGVTVFPFTLLPKPDVNRVIILGQQPPSTDDPHPDENVAFIEQQIISSTQAKEALLYSDTKNTSASALTDHTYHLVAGSFRTIENASAKKNELGDKGFGALIIQNGGYYRVVVASFDNRNKAIEELRRLRSQIDQSLWLLTE